MNKIIVGLLAAILVVQGVILLKPSKPANLVVNTPAAVQEAMGASADVTTNWTAGSFTSDVTVGGTLSVTGATAFTGAVTVTGTTTASGEAVGLVKAYSTAMSSSATTTACTVLNSSGLNRLVVSASVVDTGSAASIGSVAWSAGTSTKNGANGASTPTYTKVLDTTITRASGIAVWTTTSTVQTAYTVWPSGTYFNFVSGTTTNSGYCKLSYY